MIFPAWFDAIGRSLARRFVTPAMAASIVSKHGAAKREREALTLAECKAAFEARLADETARLGPIIVPRPVQASKARSAG